MFLYVISVSYGEYDDENKINIATCSMEAEAQLIVEVCKEKHEPLYSKMMELFCKKHGSTPETAPHDIWFQYEQLPDVSFAQKMMVE